MALRYVTPHDWVTGDEFTAAIANRDLRDTPTYLRSSHAGGGATTALYSPGVSSSPVGNQVQYLQVLGSDFISALAIFVNTNPAGQICLGVYESTGTGRARVPTNLIATTGPVPCPEAQVRTELALDVAVAVSDENYFGMVMNTGGPTFRGIAPNMTGAIFYGVAYLETPHFPLPRVAGEFPLVPGMAGAAEIVGVSA